MAPLTDEQMVESALKVFENTLIELCYSKDWQLVNQMVIRSTLLAGIARDLYKIDQDGDKCVMQ